MPTKPKQQGVSGKARNVAELAASSPIVPEGTALNIGIRELTEIAIKAKGLKEGRYELAVRFKIGVGAIGPAGQEFPGVAVGIEGIGLVPSEPGSENGIDAESLK